MEMLFAVAAVNFLDCSCSYFSLALNHPPLISWIRPVLRALVLPGLEGIKIKEKPNVQVANNFSCQRTEASSLGPL